MYRHPVYMSVTTYSGDYQLLMATDQLGNLSKSEIASQNDEVVSGRSVDTCDSDGEQLVQRCVIIQRDEKGYGLTVSGDNPVFVQSVKEDGAAARAGVQQGDRIIKVNGTLVTQSNHQDVVKLIKSGTYVALTLLGKPPGHGVQSSGTLQPLNLSGNIQSSSHISVSGKLSSPSERITGPQPVDPEKQQQLTNSRISTIRKMLEKELVYFENLRVEHSKSPSDKLHSEFLSARKRVKTLEEQLHNLTSVHHDLTAPRSPRSPPSNRFSHPEKENMRLTSTSLPGHLSSHQGRTLTHQVSAPSLPKPEKFFSHVVQIGNLSDSSSPSTTSPSQQKRSRNGEGQILNAQKQLSSSTSLENISTQLSPRTSATTWPQGGHTHSRQSSSPDALLHHVESLRHPKSDFQNVSSSEVLSRSYSEVGQHHHGRKSSASEVFSSEVEVIKRRRPTKSSSRGSSFGQYDSAVESPSGTPPSTPPLQDSEVEVTELGENCEGDDITIQDEFGTPPEGQSPAIALNVQNLASRLGQHTNIICMEDDDFSSDTEMTYVDDHGPFNGFWKLVRYPAHLSVFLYYLMSNSDPSSLFFYLIADMYEQGTGKEMKKWAYEIHSTFLFPKSPLKVHAVEETILHEIDEVLQHQLEKEEVLRTVFVKASKRAKEELNDLLADFRNKRTMGLGNIFGPPDYQLEETLHDKNKELKIIEQLLIPTLENFVEDLDNLKDRPLAMAFALATVLKQFGVKSPQAVSLIDRCPTFVAKERTRLRFLQRNKKVIFAQDHHFVPQHYYCVTYCNHCQLIIWGVGNQGYQCQNCEMNIHKLCVKSVEERCIGILRNKKDKKRDRMSGIMENIIGKGRKPSHPVPAAIERAKKLNEEWNSDSGIPSPYTSTSEIQSDSVEKSGSTSRLDKAKELGNSEEQPLQLCDPAQNNTEKPSFNKKGTSIGRSESFRQRRESRPSFRKRSDPNIPRSKSDVDVDDKSTSNLDNSGSSSNSSLSTRSLDSPSNSLEMVHRTPSGTTADSVLAGTSPAAGLQSTHGSIPSTVHHYNDSDLEAETDIPNWQENVDWEVVRLMKPKEKKRQDVINELFHTERTHVKNLKVLDRLFYRPLLQDQLLPSEFLHLLFPNLEEMLELHGNFNEKMKAKRKEEPIVGDVGEMMLQMFDGPAGEHLKKAAATFCRNQTIALENLKVRQRKDQKLAQFLVDVEADHLCRRLQLKDIIATGFQRLTKYPLLLENIAKYTAPNTDEHNNLLRAVECSKQILADANQAVKDAENQHHLSELQKKLDRSAFEKIEKPTGHNYKNLDLTKYKLLHDGPLQWRLNKQKTIEMHVVLLEEILVLLQKQDEKYILKFHNTNVSTSREDIKFTHSPILRVQNLFTRNVATDKRGFFLVSTSEQHAIYEFVAASPAERKIWLRHLAEATEASKKQIGIPLKPQESSHLITDRTESTEENSEDSEIRAKENIQQDSLSESQETTENSDAGEAAVGSLSTDKQNAPSLPSATTSSGAELPVAYPQKDSAPSPEPERKPQRRLQRVEILQIADGPQLIEPCEVVVSHGAVLQTAEPVLTPVEQLRRKDQQVASILKEKEELVADILQLQHEDFEHVAEMAGEMEGEKDAQELVLASILQANQLTRLLNETLRVTEEDAVSASSLEVMPEESSSDNNLVTTTTCTADTVSSVTTTPPPPPVAVTSTSVPSPKLARKVCKMPGASPQRLMVISTALNKYLTQLLSIITEHEEERKQLRKELYNSREQIHLLHEAHRHCSIRSHSPSNHSVSQSRPSSYISLASSASEGVYETVDHHFSPVSEERSKEVTDEAEESCNVEHTEICDVEQVSEDYNVEDGLSEMFVDAPSEESCKEHCQVTDLDSEIGLSFQENEIEETNHFVNNSNSKGIETVSEPVCKEDETCVIENNDSTYKNVGSIYF